MSLLETLLLALGLAMDATAVAAARGLAARKVRWRDAALLGALFGGFQAGMPALGWLAGVGVGRWFAPWSRWLAFGLLLAVGGKMLWEALRGDDEGDSDASFALRTLVPLAVATSLDALAVGITLPLLHAPLGRTIAIIGVVTAVLSLAALYLGQALGQRAGRKLDAAGGLVLVGIAFKLLLLA